MLRHRNEFPVEGELPSFEGATAWLNPVPLTPASGDEIREASADGPPAFGRRRLERAYDVGERR
jgi:hypothetical protein